jgi:hypothetical protein
MCELFLCHYTEPALVQEEKARSQSLHPIFVLGRLVETDVVDVQVHVERMVIAEDESIASRTLEWIILTYWRLLAKVQLVEQGSD